ncbi:MAG TPA: hypothetical protein VFL57_05200 [Bryobacteraceae bacterium]|nr:hypothetical protein [Bryobacteraceae bacterium]
MKKLLVTMLVAAGAWAQPETPPPPKVIELKHASAVRIRESGVLHPFIQQMNIDPNGRIVVLTALTAQKLTAAEELLRRLDVPQKNVELTFHVIAAGAAAPGSGNPIPTDLESVLKQLRTTFAFPSYRVLETAVVRTRDGSDGEVGGNVPGLGLYNIHFRPIRVTEGSPLQVRLDDLRLRHYTLVSRGEKLTSTDEGLINADIDVKEGQKVVVGKSTIRDSALFLVVSARVTD